MFLIVLGYYAMTKAIEGKEPKLDLTLQRRRGTRFPAFKLWDLDFVGSIVLLSNQIDQAR